MPVSKKRLFELVEDAARLAGWAIVRASGPDQFPARFAVSRDNRRHDLVVYIWNVTHGGKGRAADEFRIQITSGVSAFASEPATRTLILGWSEDRRVFAGWDPTFHTGPLGGSPSLQISGATLDAARSQGLASYRKATGEMAIAFVPEFMGVYLEEQQSLHALGQEADEAALLAQVASDPATVPDALIDASLAPAPRAYALRITRSAVRDIRFRRNVLDAYEHQCAMCGVQLDLLQAAHIVPVNHASGTDETGNGVALCPLHHAAYDAGLVTFLETFEIKVNEEKVASLASDGRSGGIDGFRKGLRGSLILPKAISIRPKAAYVELANELRGWQE